MWKEVLAGQKAYDATGSWLPDETVDALREYIVGIKGPLTTPVGGGIRSLNVALRQMLDLFACVRPVRYYQGTSPVKRPELVDITVFRENTEDVYSGVEWREGTAEARRVIEFLNGTMKTSIREDSGIGVKPISITGTRRLVKMAVEYALANGKKIVTLVHKGNIMKFTEGAFRDWGYQLAKDEFAHVAVTEDDLWKTYDGKLPEGKILVNDRIADSMFQQVLLRPPSTACSLSRISSATSSRMPLPPRWEGSAWRRGPISAFPLRCSRPPTARPQVRGARQGQSRLSHPLGRHDARLYRMERGCGSDPKRHRQGHLGQAGDL